MTGSSSSRPTQPGTKTFPASAADAAPTQRQTRTDRVPFDPPADHRVEPSIDDRAFPAGASSAYEKLHGLGPDFGEGQYRRQGRSRLWRIAMMTGVFVIGAGVGLAAAWWFHKPLQGAPIAASPPTPMQTTPALPSADGRRPATVRGISPSELPYDGAPPPTAGQPSPAPVAVQAPSPANPETTSGESIVEAVSERNSGAGAVEQEHAAVSTPPAAERKPAEGADAGGADERKSAKAVKQGGTSVANATPKRKSVTRTDREIERIRRQVDEELKKKTEHGRASNNARPSAGQGASNADGSRRNPAAGERISRVSVTRASLAKCDRNTNFIRREFCRWQVCSGSWGKNGCPSYQQQTPTY